MAGFIPGALSPVLGQWPCEGGAATLNCSRSSTLSARLSVFLPPSALEV